MICYVGVRAKLSLRILNFLPNQRGRLLFITAAMFCCRMANYPELSDNANQISCRKGAAHGDRYRDIMVNAIYVFLFRLHLPADCLNAQYALNTCISELH